VASAVDLGTTPAPAIGKLVRCDLYVFLLFNTYHIDYSILTLRLIAIYLISY
jgi:hypothetical protein